MKTSSEINELAFALSKAQGQMTGAEKTEANFFKGRYADLREVIKAISKPFSNNELCFVQGAEFREGHISIKTRIMHSSGQWIESETILPPTKNDVHGYGSAITYGKRYGLQALAGVPSIDDDGQEAVAQKEENKPIYYSNFVKDKSKMVERFLAGATAHDIIDSIESKGLIVSVAVKSGINKLSDESLISEKDLKQFIADKQEPED